MTNPDSPIFDEVETLLNKAKRLFNQITDDLPDNAFMEGEHQAKFDKAHNGFPDLIGNAIDALKDMGEYNHIIKEYVEKKVFLPFNGLMFKFMSKELWISSNSQSGWRKIKEYDYASITDENLMDFERSLIKLRIKVKEARGE